MDFLDAINNLGAVVAVVVFFGAALVFLKGSVYKGAITALESTVAAQEKRIKILEDQDKKKTEMIASLKEQNKLLLQQRPSAELIHEMSVFLLEHDKKLTDFIEESRKHYGG